MLLFKNDADAHTFHSRLARHNIERMAIGTPRTNWEEAERIACENKILEGRYLESLRASIAPLVPEPMFMGDDFTAWFDSLAECGPGQHHPLLDWLANEANLTQMKWFLTQETVEMANFEDLIALTQIQLPAQAKLECARNFWDEMGHGKPGAMHGPLLKRMVHGLHLQPSIASTVWESLALHNTMIGLASSRRYTYHALGAIGVAELIASERAGKISQGMRRLGLDPWIRSYFDLHAALNVAHSRSWIREVIRPLVGVDPECAQYIAEGALMRLRAGQICLDRYTQEFELQDEIVFDEQNTSSLFFSSLHVSAMVSY